MIDRTGSSERRLARWRRAAALTPFLKLYPRTTPLDMPDRTGVPAGPLNRIEDTFTDPQIVHRGLRLELVAADGSRVPGVASPIVINGERMVAEGPSLMLGV